MAKKVVPLNQKQEPATRPITKGNTEKDPDDWVHSPDSELGNAQNEDPDDLVHKAKGRDNTDMSGMEDPDDLVHDDSEEDDNR